MLDIRRFTVSQWGEAQARRYLAELRQVLRLLSETPSLGKDRPDVGPNVSSFPMPAMSSITSSMSSSS
ncbi:MAG: type II toxin-antitoxin system RelE/ParE family toxin [Gammaproteobacteria bacterium]